MSIGYERDRGRPRAERRRLITGYCNPSNPAKIHETCDRLRPGRCDCECHRDSEGGHASSAGGSGADVREGATVPPSELTAGFFGDIPEDQYHADTVSLSVSGAKTLLKSPALFRYQQENPPYKDVWEFGSAVHALVLGSGMEQIYVTPCDDWKTKAAQEERRIAREERLSPVTPKDWQVASDMAEALALHPIAGSLFEGGQPEVSAYCTDEATGVLRRSRFDYLRDDLVIDYKTDRTSDPREFGRTAANFGYHQQAAWYLDLVRDLGHKARGFLFVVQMKEPPYLVSVCELTHDAIERGRELNQRALEMFRDCTESDLWPGWGDGIHSIDLPAWAYFDKQETA